jgi:hypothetical protein
VQREKTNICVEQIELDRWTAILHQAEEEDFKTKKGKAFSEGTPLVDWITTLDGGLARVWNAWDPKKSEKPANWDECGQFRERALILVPKLKKRLRHAALKTHEMSAEEFLRCMKNHPYVLPSDFPALEKCALTPFLRKRAIDLYDYIDLPKNGLVRDVLDGIKKSQELTGASSCGARFHFTPVKPGQFEVGVGQTVVSLVPSSCSESERTAFLLDRARNPGQVRVHGCFLKNWLAELHGAAACHLVGEYRLSIALNGFSAVKVDARSSAYDTMAEEAMLGHLLSVTTPCLVPLYQPNKNGENVAALGLSSFVFVPTLISSRTLILPLHVLPAESSTNYHEQERP